MKKVLLLSAALLVTTLSMAMVDLQRAGVMRGDRSLTVGSRPRFADAHYGDGATSGAGQRPLYNQPDYYNKPVTTPPQQSSMANTVYPEARGSLIDAAANEAARREGFGNQGPYENRGVVGNAINRVLR